ncbi:hypothetical protein GH741_13765 [Aquibacillus halophilus]|uniref:DUF1292 domain-containing protein n=1 Tax=Aquibacillus halophilus TaxID=930132 RepID=A0A6A8DET1_9BACI|nr:hypothetical protein [Aquibacillus halophilus]MRH43740.1 hypothetical protein [Aquibacillus halophilus]
MENNQIIEADDSIVIEDQEGNETTHTVDAVIEMNGKNYVLYSAGDILSIKEIVYENEEQLLTDVPEEQVEELFNAYEKALEEES